MPADANGVEALPGESEAEYVARQTRLREEAAARMRAKFGGSGGLSGGMRMGGVGSGGNTGGGASELLSSLGTSAAGGLSSLAGNASWLLGSAAETASALAATVSEKAKGSGQREPDQEDEYSRDISDLLGSATVQDLPQKPPASRPAVQDDGWNGSWDAPAPKSASLPKPAINDGWNGSWDVPAPTTPAPAPSTHVAITPAGASTGGRRKVAAAKVAKDSSWDDWGDDKW